MNRVFDMENMIQLIDNDVFPKVLAIEMDAANMLPFVRDVANPAPGQPHVTTSCTCVYVSTSD